MNTKLVNVQRTLVICLLAAIYIRAGSSATAQILSGASMSTPSDYVCVERGPHWKVWQRAVLQTNQSGMVRTNVHSYTELCTGLCYLQNGQYADSVEQINIAGNGAEAAQGPCKVQWAPDASTSGGAVRLTSPGGQRFSSRVYGLALRDVSTGSNVLIAEITNSTGVLVGGNQIVYPAAFAGVLADIEDTYRRSGFEQNVILREQPPSPKDYGLNPETTRLEVLTEFFNPPVPRKTTVETSGLSDDVNLDFEDMGIGPGTAFLTPGRGRPAHVKVSKHWERLDDGRVFLIEEVPYQAITNLVQALPLHSSNGTKKESTRKTASLKSLLQKPRATAKPAPVPIKVAQALPKRPGFVIDYSLLSGSLTNYVFQGDTTYYISGEVDLWGSPIFEEGTVVKFTNTSDACLEYCEWYSNIVFATYPYRPAVFTSSDDNSVGAVISGSSGTPSTNGLAIYILTLSMNENVLIQNARFSYAGTAFDSWNDWSHIFRDCQFVHCGTSVDLYNDTDVYFENILAMDCGSMVDGGALGAWPKYDSRFMCRVWIHC